MNKISISHKAQRLSRIFLLSYSAKSDLSQISTRYLNDTIRFDVTSEDCKVRDERPLVEMSKLIVSFRYSVELLLFIYACCYMLYLHCHCPHTEECNCDCYRRNMIIVGSILHSYHASNLGGS